MYSPGTALTRKGGIRLQSVFKIPHHRFYSWQPCTPVMTKDYP